MLTQQLALVAILGLASYRITRLLVRDSISERPRQAIAQWAYDSAREEFRSPLRQSVAYFSTCPFCVGVYATAGLYALWDHWHDARFVVLVAAAAGVQSFLASRSAA